MKPFSKLKKQIENLFDPVLNMEFCCSAYPMRSKTGNAHNSIPRFYLKMGKQIIWDYPKDFEAKDIHYAEWADNNGISALVREYIDTPINELLDKEFSGQYKKFGLRHTDSEGWKNEWSDKSDPDVVASLTDLFKAADRRISKSKIVKWSANLKNFKAYRVISVRLYGWEGLTRQSK